MLSNDLLKEIDVLFSDVFDIILALEENNLKTHGLNGVTIKELHLIHKIDVLTKKNKIADPKTLIKELSITKGTLSVATTRLIKKNLIKKIEIDGDKRKVGYLLTENSLPLITLHDNWHEKLVNHVVNNIDEVEAKALHSALSKINQVLLSDEFDSPR